MSEEKDIKLGYRPDIKYQDDYHSDITNTSDTESQESQDTYNPIKEAGNKIEAINILANKLPKDLKNMISDVLEPIKDVWDEIKDEPYTDIPSEEEWDYVYNPIESDDDYSSLPTSEPPESIYDIDMPDDDDIGDFEDDVHIIDDEHTKKEIIEAEYIRHIADVVYDYTTNLHDRVTTYWTAMLPIMYNKTQEDVDFINNKLELKSSDVKPEYKHIIDFCIRSEINRDMKMSFFKNMYQLEETMVHLRAFKMAYELRKRYCDISLQDSDTRLGSNSNNVLEACNMIYDRRYDEAYASLYKYLNSSVKILKDVFDITIQEAKTKQILLDGKGIIKHDS